MHTESMEERRRECQVVDERRGDRGGRSDRVPAGIVECTARCRTIYVRSLAGRPSCCDDTAGREGERRVNANESCSMGGVLYIVVPYCNDGAKSPHPKPAMPAAVLHGCTSILGSGRVARAAEVTAMLS